MAGIHSDYGVFSQQVLDKFVDQLQNEIDAKYIKGTEQNMRDAIKVIEDRSQELVPEDTGRTRRSWFDEIKIEGGQITGTFGYDKAGVIDYIPLIYVNPFDFNWQKEGAQDYWLDKAVTEKTPEVLEELSKKPK